MKAEELQMFEYLIEIEPRLYDRFLTVERNVKAASNSFYDAYLDLQEQFNPGLDMIGFVPYLVDTDSTTIKSNLEELYKQHKEDNLVFQNIIKRSNKVSTWSKNGITEHKGYDKKVLSMYENVFFEMLAYSMQ